MKDSFVKALAIEGGDWTVMTKRPRNSCFRQKTEPEIKANAAEKQPLITSRQIPPPPESDPTFFHGTIAKRLHTSYNLYSI